jgi:hypothetical protein
LALTNAGNNYLDKKVKKYNCDKSSLLTYFVKRIDQNVWPQGKSLVKLTQKGELRARASKSAHYKPSWFVET